MLYICEGVDKCGKTTYIQNVIGDGQYIGIDEIDKYKLYEFGNKIDVRFDRNSENSIFDNMLKVIELSKTIDVYLDRSFISEVVYGPIYRGKCRITANEIKLLFDKLQLEDAIILYFVPYNYGRWITSLDKKDYFEKDRTKIQEVLDKYDEVMKNYSFILDVYKMSFIHESV